MSARVMFVVGSLDLGGIERQVTELCLALQAEGMWKPIVCCLADDSGPFRNVLADNQVQVLLCRINKNNLPGFSLRMGKLVRQVRPQIVHSHVDFSLPWQVLGYRLGGVRSIVVTQQNDYQNWKKSLFARLRIILYYRLVRSQIKAYTSVSSGVRKSFADLVCRSESEFEVVHNAIDLLKFKPNPAGREWARTEMGVSADEFVIGCVARFDPQKAHDILLHAMRKLADSAPHARLVLVGAGQLRTVIEELIQSLGLAECVVLMGLRTDVHLLYAGFDCFALASHWEGMPISLIEGMASGLPIVATRIAGVEEAVNGENGWLVSTNDPDALAGALLEIIRHPEEAGRRAQAGSRKAEREFGIMEITRQYQAIYTRVVNETSREKDSL